MSMSMSMGLSHRLEMGMSLRVSLADMFGETAGDIPVYSLHRIKTMLRKRPLGMSRNTVGILERKLIAANEEYRADSGNDWYCLTSANLASAIEAVDSRLREIIAGAAAMPREAPKRSAAAQETLERQREIAVGAIKAWFEKNYEDLLYNMSGKIPWPIVLRMRKNLGTWIGNAAADPFGQDIGDMVLEVARTEGFTGDDPEAGWEFMGGKLMNKRSRRP